MELDGRTLVATAPAQNVLIAKTVGDRTHSCKWSGADATYNQDDAVDISLTLLNLGGEEAGDVETAEVEGEMTGRSPAVLMARELMFRTCELAGNYDLSKQEALALHRTTINAISANWGAEAANTTVSISENLTTQDVLSLSAALSGADTRTGSDDTRSEEDDEGSDEWEDYSDDDSWSDADDSW